MAITQALCTSFKSEILQGIHTNTDTYKIALFTSSATLNASTIVYTDSNEVSSIDGFGNSTGYTAGGVILTGFNIIVDGSTAILDFDNPSWANASITARCAQIYNNSKSNKSVAILDFGADQISTLGTFLIEFPTPDATSGLIRIN